MYIKCKLINKSLKTAISSICIWIISLSIGSLSRIIDVGLSYVNRIKRTTKVFSLRKGDLQPKYKIKSSVPAKRQIPTCTASCSACYITSLQSMLGFGLVL